MNVTPDVTDCNMIAWSLFTQSLDVELLELERCVGSAPSADIAGRRLHKERFGSKEHHAMVWAHDLRRGTFRRVLSQRVVPMWFNARQLQIAADALKGVAA